MIREITRPVGDTLVWFLCPWGLPVLLQVSLWNTSRPETLGNDEEVER